MKTEHTPGVRAIDRERRFRMAFDAAAVGIALVDLSGRMVECNGALHDMLGYQDGELRGKTFPELTYPPDLGDANEPFADFVADRHESHAVERRYMHKDGSLVWATLTAAVVRDAGNAPRYGVGIVADASDRRRLEEELTANERLAAVGRVAGALVADMRALTSDGRTETTLVDANAAIRELQPLLTRILGRGIPLTLQLSDEPLSMFIDVPDLQLVLAALALEARDAMHGEGSLLIESETVSAVPSDESPAGCTYARLSITDTSVEPFDALRAPRRPTMHAVYSILNDAGGSVHLRSDPCRNRTVDLLLPIVNRDGPSGNANPHAGETVLVVEDERSVRRVASRSLADAGFRVIAAANGEEAMHLASVTSDPIDVVVTDVVMPGMTGATLVARIRAIRPSIKVLYISGHSDTMLSRFGIDEDAVEMLRKPFTPAQLSYRVRQVLG